jgi:hypothetical protein
LINYQLGIQERIGADRLLQLHEKANQTKKYTREELRNLIAVYKEKIKKM